MNARGRILRALHGWGTHAGIFSGLEPSLPAPWTLEPVDLPGHGRAHREAFSLESASRSLAGIARPGEVWLGWSLGATVALAAAAARSDGPAALVLVGATPRFLAAGDWPDGMAVPVFQGFRSQLAVDLQRTLDRFIALEVHGSDTAARDRRRLREVLGERPLPSRTTLEAGLEVLETTDLRDRVARVTCPVLVMAGDHDRIVRPEASRALARSLPRGRFERLSGCGHAPFLGHPRRFGTLLGAFLEEIDHESAP